MPTQRISLAGEYNNREASAAAGGKDLRLVNCYTETIGDKRYVVKRPGLKLLYQGSPGTPQGIFSWGDNDYFVIGGKLYKNGNQLTDSDLAGLSTTSQVDFTIGKDSAGNEVLYMSDQAQLYMIESDDDVTVENPSSPSSWVYGVEFFDGYLFIMDVEGTIYNGPNAFAGDDAMDFSAPDTLTVGRGFGGIAVCLKAFNNYILAFKRNGLEFFYDAGNATGSPLSPYRAYASDIGCVSGATVARTEETVLWVGQSTGGGVGVYLLDGLKPKKISTYAVDKILEEEGTTLSSAAGFHIKVGGHYFYILSLNTLGRTLVYDITENQWEEWGYYVNEGGTEVGTDFRLITSLGYDATATVVTSKQVCFSGADTDDFYWISGEGGVSSGQGVVTWNIDKTTPEITVEKETSLITGGSGFYFKHPDYNDRLLLTAYASNTPNIITVGINTTNGTTSVLGARASYGSVNISAIACSKDYVYTTDGPTGSSTKLYACTFNGTVVSAYVTQKTDCHVDMEATASQGNLYAVWYESGYLFVVCRSYVASNKYWIASYTYNGSAFTLKAKLEITADFSATSLQLIGDGDYLYLYMGGKIIAYSYTDSAITKASSNYTTNVPGTYCDIKSPGYGKLAMLDYTAGAGHLYMLTFNGSSFTQQAYYDFPATDFASNQGGMWADNYYLGVISKPSATYDTRFYLFYSIPSSTFKGAGAGNSGGNKALVLDSESGAVYQVDSGTYDDNGEPISTQIITDKLDGATNKNKIGNRLEVVGDYETSSGNLDISWSDDDYKTFNTARTVDVDNRMILSRLGRFQRRAFKLVHEEKAPLRLEALELEYDLAEYGQ